MAGRGGLEATFHASVRKGDFITYKMIEASSIPIHPSILGKITSFRSQSPTLSQHPTLELSTD